MNVRIVFRPSRSNPNEGYLNLRLYYQGHSKQVSMGLKIAAEEWDESASEIVVTNFSLTRRNYLLRVNSELRNKLFHVNRLLAAYQNQEEPLDLTKVIDEFKESSSPKSFLAYTKLLVEKLLKEERYRTSEAYLSAMRRILRFNDYKDFSLDRISGEFVERFERHLQSQHLSLNTISFYMRNFRAVYNKAISDKVVIAKLDNPFNKVYTGVKTTPKRALSKEELNQVYSLNLSNVFKAKPQERKYRQKQQELEQARDLFLFSFYARGMSFVDIAFLKKSDIKSGILSYRRRKTGQQLDIKVNRPLREIISKYSKYTKYSPYIFPIVEDPNVSIYHQYQRAIRRQNQSLKLLQELSGIHRTITTHVARHTWATIAKEENLSIWTISESLGHSSVKTTYIYLASINKSKLDEANDIVTRAVGFFGEC